MNKKEYIARQLRRTHNKKYENYCITGIWHLLHRYDLQIITQQLFRRNGGKIALADLYFPQLGIMVEVDEYQHNTKEAKLADKQREEEIKDIVKKKIEHFESIIRQKEITILRIIIGKNEQGDEITLREIDEKIREVVDQISAKAKETEFEPWTLREKTLEEYLAQGKINANDNIKIRLNRDVMRLFGRDYRNFQRGYLRIDKEKKKAVWMPRLRLEDTEFKNNRFINTCSDDGKYIYETSMKRPVSFMREALKDPETRYVFPKYIDELNQITHKFLGVYELDVELTKQRKVRVWKRKSKTLDLSEWNHSRSQK